MKLKLFATRDSCVFDSLFSSSSFWFSQSWAWRMASTSIKWNNKKKSIFSFCINQASIEWCAQCVYTYTLYDCWLPRTLRFCLYFHIYYYYYSYYFIFLFLFETCVLSFSSFDVNFGQFFFAVWWAHTHSQNVVFVHVYRYACTLSAPHMDRASGREACLRLRHRSKNPCAQN